MHSKEAV